MEEGSQEWGGGKKRTKCGERGNSRMRSENNKIVEEGTKEEKIEEGK